MCGRFVSASTPEEVAAYFGASLGEALLEPSYNVAPTQDVLVVRSDGRARRVEAYRWGLVPSWAKDPRVGSRMVNARAETLAEKSVYRNAFKRRRCIVPASGFYEWQAVSGSKRKQPNYIHRPDGEPLAFAGLWEQWKGEDGVLLRSCTIITCPSNEVLAPIHDRMPVVLAPGAWDEWLDPDVDDIGSLGRLLVPAPPALLVAQTVSTEVNSVRNDGVRLIDPAPPVDAAPADEAARGQADEPPTSVDA